MQEHPFFFQGPDHRLFAVLHQASGVARGGLVFCHPFMEEKLWAHRVHVSLARALAQAGWGVLRFDMRGNGDSEGLFRESTVEDYIADFSAACGQLRDSLGPGARIGAFGLRLGANVALAGAERSGLEGPIVLWEPITSGQRYGQEILRSNLTSQMAVHGKVQVTREQLVQSMRDGEAVDVEGYELTSTVFDSLSAIDLSSDDPVSVRGPCLVAQTVKDERQPLRKDLEGLLARLPRGSVLEKAVEEPFWREIRTYYGHAPRLTQLTLDWLEEREQ